MADMNRIEVLDLYRKLRTQWASRNGEYDLARQRYNGIHWDAATNPEPVNRYSLTMNYLKPFVDKSIQSLVGRVPAVQVMPAGTDIVARRHAEQLEGVLYGTWQASEAPKVLFNTAWNSFVLRRGLIYVWWDPKKKLVRFKSCTPDHFYPEYDGEEIWRAVYVSRRNTARLKSEFPDSASLIKPDSEMDFGATLTDDRGRVAADDQTTIIDVFTADGSFTRVMGDAVRNQSLKYPFHGIPFVEFPCYPQGGFAEPLNMIDQLVELNQYLDQLVSQKADIIARYANPTILDHASGQSLEDIRRAVAAQGAVIPIRRDGQITLLNWQGTVPAIDQQITLVLDVLFDLAGKPRSAFGQTLTNQSGIMTNLSLNPTLQSNEAHESVWGAALSQLNEYILMLWEEFMSGDEISFRGRYQKASGATQLYDVVLRGQDISGWYKNRIKWPSAVRTDDPVYVQNLLQQLQAQPFPALSLYTYLEDMGREDVEAEIDRIGLQLQDPRFHPDRMEASVNALTKLQGSAVSGVSEGPGAPPPVPGADQAQAASLAAAGTPPSPLG
ncbi:MAG: hypothetical protein E4H01_00420 [Lysobacterales bacterium]|nr:MAG: hypothetical protein E4H01_00420 [Xanthomonadales bacterium]